MLKTKEEQKLPEIKNLLQLTYIRCNEVSLYSVYNSGFSTCIINKIYASNVIGPLYLKSAPPLPEIIKNQSVPLQKKRRSLKENKDTNLAAPLYKNLWSPPISEFPTL